jgi:hypothetical protein
VIRSRPPRSGPGASWSRLGFLARGLVRPCLLAACVGSWARDLTGPRALLHVAAPYGGDSGGVFDYRRYTSEIQPASALRSTVQRAA